MCVDLMKRLFLFTYKLTPSYPINETGGCEKKEKRNFMLAS